MAAIHPADGVGPFSDAQRLRRLPGAPAIELQGSDRKLSIRWQPGGPDERFQLQVARDPQFAPALVDLTLSDPAAELPELASGTYHLRARTIAGDGYLGEWGATQQFEVRSPQWHGLLILLQRVGTAFR